MTLNSLMLTLFALALLLTAAMIKPTPRLIYNVSGSVPLGFYLMHRDLPAPGEIAVIHLPDHLASYAERHKILLRSALLLKPVVLMGKGRLCRFGRQIFVNGKKSATARATLPAGQPLPHWQGCFTLTPDQIVVLSHREDAYDSRYFGPLSLRFVKGVARGVAHGVCCNF